MPDNTVKKDDISIVICGEAGQGMDTVASMLATVFKKSCYHIYSTKEFMSRIRGGSNSTTLRVSSRRVDSNINRIDFLIPLDNKAIKHLEKRINEQTFIFGEDSFVTEPYKSNSQFHIVPFNDIAKELGNKIYSNTVAAGFICGLTKVDEALLEEYLKDIFSQKPEEVIQKNIEAAQKGYKLGEKILKEANLSVELQKDCVVQKEPVLAGVDAVSMGCIAGGCDFIASYPMSPSTGVLTFLANESENFNILVEQAEDEIAAINMSLGASYAGARAMVTTSGGGFALMCEGVSLAGIIETPVVIHIAQRPGPATGLPTRTEQGDLELVLYAGHGEFPRIIFAPGNLEQAFYLSQKAFNLADKYQIPVFILSDEYLVDTYHNTPLFNFSNIKTEEYVVKTDNSYLRYRLTDNGISPRGIPGYGSGLVKVDSDEHTEEGCITEDADVRSSMQDKRLNKLDLVSEDIEAPLFIGSDSYKTLVICWGSTLNMVKEAVYQLDNDSLAILHFSQVYPLHASLSGYLAKAESSIIIENNSTSQFSKLIKLDTGYEIDTKILKYNGAAFSVEEIVEQLENLI